MGEKLELRLKSPVGAEPAVYPWPLPVYVSVRPGERGGHRGAPALREAAGHRPFPARARGCRCPDAACRAVVVAGLELRVADLCGSESGATLWAGLGGRGRLAFVSTLMSFLRVVNLTSPNTMVPVVSGCLLLCPLMSSCVVTVWCWWSGANGTLESRGAVSFMSF